MAQKKNTPVLSAEALTSINYFVNSSILIREEREVSLIASLYAQRDNADKEVVSILRDMIVKLEDTLSEDQILTLFNEYDAVVRKCYDDIRNGSIKSRRDILQLPEELVNFCIQAVEVKPHSKVFLPYAGNAEFALALPECHCSGFEASGREWALSQIVLDAFQLEHKIERSESAISFFDDVLIPKYDYIFTMPPMQSGKFAGYITKSIESILTHCLKKNGTMCLIMPESASDSMIWRQFRELMAMESDKYSLAVIDLPPIFRPFTVVNTNVWIIQKQGDNGDRALMVNAKDDNYFVTDKQTRRSTIKTEAILKSIAQRDTRVAREIPFEKMGADYRFSPARYFTDAFLPEAKPDEKFYELGDLIEVLGPQPRPIGKTIGKIIGMRELSDNYLTPEIDASSLPEGDTAGLVPTTAEGVLIGFIGDRFKVGIVNNLAKDEIVFLRREIIRFQLAPKAPIKKEYLLRELMSDYVRNQARNYASGAAIQRISKDDMLSLQILVPSRETQDKLVFADGLAGMSAADRERVQSFEKFRKNMHMMKHGLGQSVFNLQNWMQMVEVARKSPDSPINDNAQIGGLVKIRMGEVFDNIGTALQVLSRQISTFDVGYGMKVTNFSLADFIDHYIETHPRPHVIYDFPSQQYHSQEDIPNFDVDDSDSDNITILQYPGEYIVKKGDALHYVEFSEDALSIIVDNIVSNAVAHGFKDPNKDYTIRFEFKPTGSSYVLSISNNGESIPARIKPDEVFIWGNTSGGKDHAGIGCYQVKDLMEEFGGKAEIISTPDEEFTVTYKLTFTKTDLESITL